MAWEIQSDATITMKDGVTGDYIVGKADPGGHIAIDINGEAMKLTAPLARVLIQILTTLNSMRSVAPKDPSAP